MSGNNGNGHPSKPNRRRFQYAMGRASIVRFFTTRTRYYTRTTLLALLKSNSISTEFRRRIESALSDGSTKAIRELGPAYAASGMDWIEVSRSDAIAAGAIAATDKVEPADPSGFNENLEMTPGLANSDILDELLKSLGDVVTLKNGVLGFS